MSHCTNNLGDTASPERVAIHIVTNRFGDLDDVDRAAAELLNIGTRRVNPLNLLHFFAEGRLELARDLHAVASIAFPARDAILRPKERAPRRVAVSVCEIEHGVRWTLEDFGPVRPGRRAPTSRPRRPGGQSTEHGGPLEL